ncbi:MAG TPA: hypothetical protein VMX55_00065 [candidate division Zixibacteria bacterium]|nr:hypothetical protein [candidate division Zixibacteria bacterium]
MIFKGNKTWLLIRQSSYLKSRFMIARVGLSIISLVLAFYFSMIGGGFNIYYYFLDVLKIVFFYSIGIAAIYFIIGDEEDYENWNNREYRKKSLKEKLILSLIEGGVFLFLSTTLLGFFYLLDIPYSLELDFLNLQSDISLLHYVPNPIEGILFAFIMLMQLIAPIAGICWQYSRCMTVVGFIEERKALKIKPNVQFALPFLFMIIWVQFAVFLDQVYFNLVYPDVFPNFNILEGSIFSSQPYLYLVVQLGVLLVLNLFFIIDSLLANKYRTNFIALESLAIEE